MLADIFGKNIFSKTIGTRTNVIKLPSADKRRLFKNDLDIGRANESQTETIKKELEDLIPDIPKMNDMEKLTLEGNVRRLYNKLFPQETSGEVIDIATKKKVTGEGLESLKEKAGIPEGVEPGSLMDRLNKSIQKLQAQKEAFDKQLKEMPSPLKPSGMDLATGLTRTATRKILDRAGIKVADKADPIDIFEKEFGGDALMDVKDVAEEMIEIERMGKATKSIDEILEQSGLFNIKRNPNARKGMSDAELQKRIKEEDVKSKADEDYLKKIIDPEEPEEFNTGGRVGLKSGSYLYKAYKGSALEKLMNNPRVEGTVLGYEGIGSLIDILRGFGLFSKGGRVGYAYGSASKFIMGIINSIKKLKPIDAMKEMNEVVAKRGKYKNLSDEEVQKIFDDTNDHIFEREVKPKETDVNFDEDMGEATPMSEIETVEAMGAPITAKTLQLMEKYPGLNLDVARKIASDPDPQRQAEVIAIIDQAFEMNKKGMSMDEIVDVFSKNTDRTKQAQGGLTYLMGL